VRPMLNEFSDAARMVADPSIIALDPRAWWQYGEL
jgi:hypothetical protein